MCLFTAERQLGQPCGRIQRRVASLYRVLKAIQRFSSPPALVERCLWLRSVSKASPHRAEGETSAPSLLRLPCFLSFSSLINHNGFVVGAVALVELALLLSEWCSCSIVWPGVILEKKPSSSHQASSCKTHQPSA